MLTEAFAVEAQLMTQHGRLSHAHLRLPVYCYIGHEKQAGGLACVLERNVLYLALCFVVARRQTESHLPYKVVQERLVLLIERPDEQRARVMSIVVIIYLQLVLVAYEQVNVFVGRLHGRLVHRLFCHKLIGKSPFNLSLHFDVDGRSVSVRQGYTVQRA